MNEQDDTTPLDVKETITHETNADSGDETSIAAYIEDSHASEVGELVATRVYGEHLQGRPFVPLASLASDCGMDPEDLTSLVRSCSFTDPHGGVHRLGVAKVNGVQSVYLKTR